jgi:general secretion pathway protein J
MISGPIAFTQSDRQRRSAGCKGFTLLEILVAMFILTIVMGLVFGSFNGVFSNADQLNASGDQFEMADACLSRNISDLEAIHVLNVPRYKPPDMDSEPDIFRIVGSNETMGGNTFAKLRFTSLAHLAPGKDADNGIAEIVYYVQPSDSDGVRLFRSDQLYPYPEFEPKETDPVMCEQLLSFKLTYFDKEGREFEDWNSEDDDYDYSTPRAIRIELKLGSEENSYEFRTAVTLPAFRSISHER